MPRHVSRRSGVAKPALGLVAALLALSSLAVVPVAAGTPTINRNVVIDETRLLPNTSRQCEMDVYLHQYGVIGFKIQVRESGVLTLQEISVRVAGTYFAPSTGRSVDIHVNDAGTNIETIFPDGREVLMNAGTDGVVTVAGYGHVYIGVGRVLVTVDPAGNVTELSVGARDPDRSGICPLLR
jgi:hypothetical protein